VIHWTVAALVTVQLAIAVVLGQLRSLDYGQLVLSLHRQLGLVILLLVLTRFVIARRHAPPKASAGNLPAWQVNAAALVHRLFLCVLVVQPILGIFVAWGRGDTVGILGVLQISAPMEFSDAVRERVMTAHTAVAIALFGLCVLHVGAVVFNRVVRRVSVIDRMLPAREPGLLVNRVSVALQLNVAFGLVVAIAAIAGINAVATYRASERANDELQQGDVAAADQTRAAQVAWKELVGLSFAPEVNADAQRAQELADATRSSLEEAVSHTPTGDIRNALEALVAKLGSDAGDLRDTQKLRDIDASLQEIVDSQGLASFQHRTDNQQRAASGHDLIVITLLPMLLAGLVAAVLLARSITGSLGQMAGLIRSIESERRDGDVHVVGDAEFASLTREIVSMRAAVEQRAQAAADQRAQFDAERVRLAEEQQQREVAAERQARVDRQVQRDRLAGEFELRVAVIVDTVARIAQDLTATASSMAASAANTTERSRQASTVADQTSGTASLIARGTAELSGTAQSVRQNAEQSQARAALAVKEAAAATEQIQSLLAAIQQIGSITETIAGVARQTNLLAINARIEAARAGDVGRGFSIVANEVKALANQTQDATHGIGARIEEVVSAAARSSEYLQKLREVIAGVEETAGAIFKATDEQFASTRDMADRVAEISASTGSVAENIRHAQSTASDTEALSGEVSKAAEVMDEQAMQLREQVARFVLQLREAGSGASAAPALVRQVKLQAEDEQAAPLRAMRA
jgi:methyl-accepting chemotaxis protein